MVHRNNRTEETDLDGLRLVALGRIPRCGACPRFHALVDAHARDLPRSAALPGVPEYCTHQVCAPLVARYEPHPKNAGIPAPSMLHRQAC
jgi:hypothetical protein